MAITPLQSRIEELLANGSNAVKPQSRIEILLVELLQFIETGMASVFHYRGSVATYADLLLIQNPEVGDVYNVQTDSMNYAWDGTAWDTLGAILAIDSTITQNSQNPVTSAAIYSALAGKVDAIVGKGLSTEDYTSVEKEKLSGIEPGAEVNVNADWEAESGDAQILHKPTLGAAAAKGVDSAPTASSTNLVESGGVSSALGGKQDALTSAQQAAVDSGITAAKVSTYDGYATSKMSAADVFGRGTLIASGADLDDLKSIGMYYSNDKTRSQSLTNSPFTTTGFTLEVKKSYQSQGNTDGINQIAYSFANDAFTVKARIYRYSGSPATWSWTDWQTLSFVTT